MRIIGERNRVTLPIQSLLTPRLSVQLIPACLPRSLCVSRLNSLAFWLLATISLPDPCHCWYFSNRRPQYRVLLGSKSLLLLCLFVRLFDCLSVSGSKKRQAHNFIMTGLSVCMSLSHTLFILVQKETGTQLYNYGTVCLYVSLSYPLYLSTVILLSHNSLVGPSRCASLS